MKEIVHIVKIGCQEKPWKGTHKEIHVACEEGDEKYVDMVHNFSHRLSLYTSNPFSFRERYKDVDGIMVIITGRMIGNSKAQKMIEYTAITKIPIIGVDVRSRDMGHVPDIKLTRLHWEGLSNFIDSL
jgi:hypothetical protein